MKALFFIPLLGFIINSSSFGGEFKLNTRDTVYVFTSNPPHQCFYSNCPLKGEIIFQPSTRVIKEVMVQRLHFNNPLLTIETCQIIVNEQIKYVNL